MEISELYQLFLQHPVICTDSRNCVPDSLFFALKGKNYDANIFALSALEKGCSYAVVDDKKYAIDERFILVKDALQSLQELARLHRKQFDIPVIAITGTNGKTTTKELISTVLMKKFNLLSTEGNLNNHIGVPLTLLQLKPGHEIAVIEMGANHPGEIKKLAEIASPNYGLITNVGKAHLEGFGSLEGVMQAKAELYEYIYQEGEAIFINKKNQYLQQMAEKAGFTDTSRKIEYCLKPFENNIITGEIVDCSPYLIMKCITNEGTFDIETKLIGAYNAENVLAAVAVGNFFGVHNEQIKHGIENYQPQNNRSQFSVTQHNKLIVDTYNANPTSMQAAILNFADMNFSPKTLILGDMLELGKQSKKEHQNIINLLQQKNFQNVFLVGEQFSKVNKTYPSFENVEDLINYLEQHPLCNQYILIKGSRGIHLEKVLPFL
ncbi:MAG TPA: UDP-N-acetylmuramoyl-tripeptide--D-alanyl-D-alanine ligase [Paludibacteraceae bacterium]|nr:UDP-N-acetylmuramoyl-tripeptide--D-alanyl-D-alanine ligase [Paludibacteraceae bacterium]